MLSTIGYEGVTQQEFLSTLKQVGVDLVIDIRDRAQSRRPGFSKSSLSAGLEGVGIAYTHLKALGDPKEGREAARAGDISLFERIFQRVLASDAAELSISTIIDSMGNHNVCLLCYERDYRYCHRKLVSDKIESMTGEKARHLGVRQLEAFKAVA